MIPFAQLKRHDASNCTNTLMQIIRVSNISNMQKIASSGAGTAYPSGAPDITLVFSGVSVVRTLIFCVEFCRLLFVHLSCLF
jgi:hypothetical protein